MLASDESRVRLPVTEYFLFCFLPVTEYLLFAFLLYLFAHQYPVRVLEHNLLLCLLKLSYCASTSGSHPILFSWTVCLASICLCNRIWCCCLYERLVMSWRTYRKIASSELLRVSTSYLHSDLSLRAHLSTQATAFVFSISSARAGAESPDALVC
jgi:hypothetical protein